MNWNSINKPPVNRDECLVLLLTKQNYGGIAGSPTSYRHRIKLGWWLPQINCFRFEEGDLWDATPHVEGWMELPNEDAVTSGTVFDKIAEIPAMSPAETMRYLHLIFDILNKHQVETYYNSHLPNIEEKNYLRDVDTILRTVDLFVNFLPDQVLIGYLRATYMYKQTLTWWLPLSNSVYSTLSSRHNTEVIDQLMTGILPKEYNNENKL